MPKKTQNYEEVFSKDPWGLTLIMSKTIKAIAVSLILALNISIGTIAAENIKISEPRKIIIDVSDRKLYFYNNNELTSAYPVALGIKERPTPIGKRKIINKVEHPAWYPPKINPDNWELKNALDENGAIPSGHPLNPIGKYWMGIGDGYGIHGTNDPFPIQHQFTNGCIRMQKQDIEEMIKKVKIGDSVYIQE